MESKKIYCRNCGSEMDENSTVCVKCGVAKGKAANYCPNCASETNENADVCVSCGTALHKNTSDSIGTSTRKSKVTAGILALMFGEFGIDRFYLGYNKAGIARLIVFLLSLVLCVIVVGFIGIVAIAIWIIVDTIKIFTGKTLDANGNELV